MARKVSEYYTVSQTAQPAPRRRLWTMSCCIREATLPLPPTPGTKTDQRKHWLEVIGSWNQRTNLHTNHSRHKRHPDPIGYNEVGLCQGSPDTGVTLCNYQRVRICTSKDYRRALPFDRRKSIDHHRIKILKVDTNTQQETRITRTQDTFGPLNHGLHSDKSP